MAISEWLRNQMVTPGAGLYDSLGLLDQQAEPIADQPIQIAQNGSYGIDAQYKQATGTTLTDGKPIPPPAAGLRPTPSQPVTNQLTRPSGYAMPDSEPVIKDGAKTLFGR